MNRSGTGENYIRLTGRKRTWTGFSQAWLGNDHILLVHSIRFVERYRRFALSDVQAIVITEGGRRGVWQMAVLLICLFLGPHANGALERAFFSSLGAVALTLAIIDIARGPRCRCLLQTAVSREPLLCVARMSTAHLFLATVAPVIEMAQSAIPVEEFPQVMLPERSASAPLEPTLPQPPAIARPLGYTPEILFILLMLDSILVFIAMRGTIAMAFGALPIIYFAESVMAILALVQSRARNGTMLAVLVAAFLCILIDPFALSGRAVWPGLFSALRESSASGVLTWNIPIHASAPGTVLAPAWRAAIASIGLLVCYWERTAERK
jgi:hypothetical protein